MLYFGSRNFGQANFGKGLIVTDVGDTPTVSVMQVAGFNFFNTSHFLEKAIATKGSVSGLVKTANLKILGSSVVKSRPFAVWSSPTVTESGTGSLDASGKIAWDSQLITGEDASIWSSQIVE